MSNKNRFIAKGAFYLLVGVLLLYAASRTLHFVQLVMDNSTWGYLFLFSTGVGAIIWLYVYLSYAEGAKQRAIAFVMGLVDIIGELVLVFADTVYVGDKAGLVKMTETEMNTFIIVSVVVVGVNIFAGYLFKLWDLNVEQEQHAQDLVDHVTEATMKHLNTPEAKQQLVHDLLPVLRNSIAMRVQAEVFSRASHTVGFDMRAMDETRLLPVDDSLHVPTNGYPLPTQEKAPSFFGDPKGWFQRKFGRNNQGMQLNELAVPQEELGIRPEEVAKSSDHLIMWQNMMDGSRVRIFCKICRDEHKPWLTEEPCEHVQAAMPEEHVDLSTALRMVREAMEEELPVG